MGKETHKLRPSEQYSLLTAIKISPLGKSKDVEKSYLEQKVFPLALKRLIVVEKQIETLGH